MQTWEPFPGKEQLGSYSHCEQKRTEAIPSSMLQQKGDTLHATAWESTDPVCTKLWGTHFEEAAEKTHGKLAEERYQVLKSVKKAEY